jgi:hypothetical protein
VGPNRYYQNYAILQVRHHRLEYDVDRAVAALRQQHLPAAFGHMLRQGRNLDEVLSG